MNQERNLQIIAVQERVIADPEYQALNEEYRKLSGRFDAFLLNLPEEQRNLVMDYLGIVIQMHSKMLILACE